MCRGDGRGGLWSGEVGEVTLEVGLVFRRSPMLLVLRAARGVVWLFVVWKREKTGRFTIPLVVRTVIGVLRL
jgi:hypothetical protein